MLKSILSFRSQRSEFRFLDTQITSAISGTPLSDLPLIGNHEWRLRPSSKILTVVSSRPITRISNGLHSSLTRRHRHVLNNLSPRSYRKVPSASWYDGSIVLEEELGLPHGRHTERYEIMYSVHTLSRCINFEKFAIRKLKNTFYRII